MNKQHKPSYATRLKEYQVNITSAVMERPRAQKLILVVGSHNCKVNSTLYEPLSTCQSTDPYINQPTLPNLHSNYCRRIPIIGVYELNSTLM